MNSQASPQRLAEWPATDAVDMLELLTTGVIVLDESLRLERINPAAEVLLDVSARQAIGMPLAQALPANHGLVSAIERTAFSTAVLSEREFSLMSAAGRPRTVDLTVTPLNEPGEPGGYLIELLPLDRHLRISREEYLVAQGEVARNVVRGLAHEIRNPLGGIRGAAQLLSRELNSAELEEYTSVIIEEADRLQRLLDRLLGPRTRPEPRLINIHEVTERVFALIGAEASSAITITKDYDPSIPPLKADPELLIQALLNVARNAVTAIGTNGAVVIRTRIDRHRTIGSQVVKLAVRIDVEDDGPGVPEELRDTLFYPMVTGRSDGAGLGLSISQNLVNQHRGIIELDTSSEGSTFSIVLPLEGEQA